MKKETSHNRNELAKLFTGVGVEIGVERGHFAKVIGEYSSKLYLVDPWKAYKGYREHVSQDKLDGFFEETKERLKNLNVEIIRKFSLEAVNDFEDESLDFVYIDSNHSYENVKADIEAWRKKVKKGGIVAGHDYKRFKGQAHMYGVVEAVNELKDEVTIWRGDKSPSWNFIK